MSPEEALPLLDALRQPLLLLDRQRRIVTPNLAFCSWTGVGARRWIGMLARDLGLIVALLDDALGRSADEGQPND